jgi:hypothetical protein
MNNEPVAWINKQDGNSVVDWDKDPYSQEHTPLYTHPVKELTDEEITELKNAVKDCEYRIYPSKKQWESYLVLEKHAKRLLRKAQEPDCYGDGNVYRGVRSKDSEIQTIHIDSTAKTLTDDFIYKNHMGYVSPTGNFYAPDYPTWKQDGFVPVYKEPVIKELTNDRVREIADECELKNNGILNVIDFYRALRKAGEK